jgi:predicted amidohydrolase
MRLAVLQMTAEAGAVAANLARIDAGLSKAAAAGADLLLAPELVTTGYGAGDQMARLAEPLDAPGGQAAQLAALSARHGVALVAGLPERDGGVLYNTALFTDGTRRVAYRKAQLYGPYERGLFQPGGLEPVTVSHAGLRLGLLVCYDVEFPERVRALALAGVDAVLVPTALPAGPNAALIAERMVSVRAYESQVFVAYADLCGTDGRFTYAGRSHVAAPDGETLALAGVEEALLIADLDPAAYAECRRDNPYLDDLRR